MELPFDYFPYLEYFMDNPMMLVMWSAFGVPVILVLLFLLSKFYGNGRIAYNINGILLYSFGFTWIAGFALMIILLFTGVSGMKMYFIWLLLFISSLIFTAMNFNLINKNYEDTLQGVKNKKDN